MANYLDEYSDEYVEYNDFNWQLRLNDKIIGYYETKDEAIWSLLEELDSQTNNMFFNGIGLIGFNNENELFDYLYNLCVIDFYDYLNLIYDSFEINGCEYKIVCINDDEPEFGEL